jgi:uncharacterized protein involved in type VI secretion and phage assembly
MIDVDQLDTYSDEEQRATRASRMSGLVLAEVTSNKDEDNSGRIKVTYKWHSDENETALIGVSTIMGGNDRGSVFVPEVGDQVICGFLNGDINSPICLGALHGKEDRAPVKTDDGKNNIKMIKTRSGHSIIFNDEESKESLIVRSKSDHLIEFIDVPGEEKVTIKDKTGQNYIEIDSVKNSIIINSKLNLDLKATNINIQATGTMNITANTAITVKGNPINLN